MLEKKAAAKLNLSLEVIGRRDDGYHEIVSVMQLIELQDTLFFERADELTVVTDDETLTACGEANLVWRAATLLREAAGVESGARITLHKRIPLAAGLGGGSSDAATTLLGLAELWGLRLSRGELRQLGATIGSDVPFFLEGPTALVEGRGERVTRIPPLPPGLAVLVCQPYALVDKTKRLYAGLGKGDRTDGNRTRLLIQTILDEEFPPSHLLYNAFARTAATVFDGLDEIRHQIVRASRRDVHLSGSGPTLFTLYRKSESSRAHDLYETLKAAGLRVYLARTLT